MKSKQPNRNDRNPLSEADERAIDALICEAHKQDPSPPDLSDVILRRLNHSHLNGVSVITSRDEVSSYSTAKSVRAELASESQGVRSWGLLAAGVLGLAASIFLILSLWDGISLNQANIADRKKSEADAGLKVSAGKKTEKDGRPIETQVFPAEANHDAPTPIEIAKSLVPVEGIPQVPELSVEGESQADEPLVVSVEPTPPGEQSTPSHDQSLSKLNSGMASYWNRIGVSVASPISDMELADRIENRFGSRLDLSAGAVSIQNSLATSDDCNPVAVRLVGQLFRDVPLAPESLERMNREATETIAQGGRFDELLSRWVADDSLFVADKPERLSQGLATNLLDVDAACARCHDSPVDARFGQDDYWAIAAIFAPAKLPPLFYELADGRQRLAEPRIADRWLGAGVPQQALSPDDLKTQRKQLLAKQLIGNRTLAAAIANRLWEVGFGLPLVSRASDPLAPPRDDELRKSHAVLTDAIVDSNFDIRFALRLVMASEAMRRGQSELYASGRWRIAGEDEIFGDSLAHRTFAAAPVKRPDLSRDQLVAMMGSRIGLAPREIDASATLLAQPSVVGEGNPTSVVQDKPRDDEYWWAAWVADRKLLSDSWLHWIKDPVEQKRHAFYAANVTPPEGEDVLTALLVSPSDDQSVAAENTNDRLLWILRQSK